MTTKTGTLTDFLLARIDEDEEATEFGGEIHRYSCASTEPVPYPCDCTVPARMIAEVEAKRRIVEAQGEYEVRFDWWERGAGQDGPADGVYDAVLRLLALPYSDHPDYNPDWRV